VPILQSMRLAASRAQIDAQGVCPTRYPEELFANAFTLLRVAAAALKAMQDRGTPAAHMKAIERIAPTLRTDCAMQTGAWRGSMAAVRGKPEGCSIMPRQRPKTRHGSRRRCSCHGARRVCSAGRTSCIVDASPPRWAAASFNAHASTLRLELTQRRRPLVVTADQVIFIGVPLRRAGRARRRRHSGLSLRDIPARACRAGPVHKAPTL